MDRFKDVRKTITENRLARYEQLLDVLRNNNLHLIQQECPSSYLYGALNSKLDQNGTMAIHIASEYGSFDILAYLLETFPEQLNQKDRLGQTPLFCAARSGQVRIVQYLINKRAELNPLVNDLVLGPCGLTPIISAMLREHHQVVRVLFKAMALAPQLIEQREFHWVALKWAIEQNNGTMLECLLGVTAFDSVKIRELVYLMSLAVQKSGVDVVRLLALKNKALLTLANEHGYTPVFLASCRGDVALLRYLIEEGIDLNQVFEKTAHPDFGKPMYILAHDRKHYAAANLIIHTVLNEHNKGVIFDFITNGEAALEYALLSPINANLIMKHRRLMTLIKDAGGHITSKSIGFYKTASSRRLSFYADINRETGESEVYTPCSVLGQGSNSVVRDFLNSNRTKRLAIKSPKLNWLRSDNLNEEVDLAKQEMGFIRTAYAQSDTSVGQVYSIVRHNPAGRREFTIRSVMKYAGAHSIAGVLNSDQEVNSLAGILLEMAAELIRLHDKGIVHGDVKTSNAVVSIVNNQYKIIFVDFEHAYYLTDDKATADPTGVYWAPERRVTEDAPRPNTNQDVYSFAVMLQSIIRHCSKGPLLSSLFPSILTFSENGAHSIPENRPTLRSFYRNLTVELSAQLLALEASRPVFSEVDEDIYNAIKF